MLITIPSAVFLAVPGVNFWNLGYRAVPVVDGVIVGLTLLALWLAGKCTLEPRLSYSRSCRNLIFCDAPNLILCDASNLVLCDASTE